MLISILTELEDDAIYFVLNDSKSKQIVSLLMGKFIKYRFIYIYIYRIISIVSTISPNGDSDWISPLYKLR